MPEGVSAFKYPILEEGNLSFPEGRYEPAWKPGSGPTSLKLVHRLSGCPFLENLIAEERAAYCCTVSIPITGYRKLHISESKEQEIEWSREQEGEPPVFRPLIVALKPICCQLQEKDGVSEGWLHKELKIDKGAKLGLAPFYKQNPAIIRLLRFSRNPNLRPGSFVVKACTNEGFYFEAQAADDLYQFLQNSRGFPEHRRSICTHIVSRCLEILRSDYRTETAEDGDDWRIYANLRDLAEELRQKKLPLWDNGDEFSPEKVATALYPHQPPKPVETDNSD